MIRKGGDRKTGSNPGRIFFLAILSAYAVVILAARLPPPLVDYPDWVFQGELLHHVLLGHPVAGYALKHYPVPNSVVSVGLGLLDLIMPWQWAAKLWVCLYLLLAALASFQLADALQIQSSRLMLTLPGVVFLNLNFWYGHIAFEIGVCFTMLLAARLLRGASTTAVSLLLVAIFFTHMEACAAATLLLVLWATLARKPHTLIALLPSAALTLWYIVARYIGGDADAHGIPQPDYRYATPAFLVYKANTFFKTFGFVNARAPDTRSISEALLGRLPFLALLTLSLILAALTLCAIVRGALAARRLASASPSGHLVLVLLIVSLVLPQIWLGVADPGTRLLLMATALGLFLVDWHRPATAAIALAASLLCLVNLVQFARIDRNPLTPGHRRDLPAPLLTFGHVEPATRLDFYDRLSSGRLSGPIFPTGLFVEQPPTPPKTP